jgi:sulfur carrier protein ThiS
MRITIRLGEPLRRTVGTHRLELELRPGATLADILTQLQTAYPEFAAVFSGADLGHSYPYQLFCNHRRVSPEAWTRTTLAEGDTVHIVIPALGGEQ